MAMDMDMDLQQDHKALVDTVCEIYDNISALKTLKPSKDVDTLFTQLVHACIPPSSIDVENLSARLQQIRSRLIRLCGQAEALLESHYSGLLAARYAYPLRNLHTFPYYSNYLKLSLLEHQILARHCSRAPTKVAFVGSGPLPLTSIVMATRHLRTASFHNFDVDPAANSQAARLVAADPDLSRRMRFHSVDILDVGRDRLGEFEVVFLAALVGMGREEKARVVRHLAEHMAPGAVLMLRSAHGARAFLYPVVEPRDLSGFDVLTVFHPSDEVINSVIAARRCGSDQFRPGFVLPSKCSDAITSCNPLLGHGGLMVEELKIEDKSS